VDPKSWTCFISLTLPGTVTTRTCDSQRGALQRTWRTEKLPVSTDLDTQSRLSFDQPHSKFLGMALNSKADSSFTAGDGQVKIPFRFNLDECRHLSELSHLPPSLSSKDDSFKWSQANSNADSQYNVAYSITASVFDSRGVMATSVEEVHVLPIAEPQPPLSPSDFGGEYFMAAISPHETKRRTSDQRIEVAGQEPEPLSLEQPSTGSHGHTTVPFVIKLLPTPGTSLDNLKLPTQCDLRTRLVTRTFVTPDGRKKVMPTLDDALENDDSFLRTIRTNEQTYSVALSTWTRYRPSKSSLT
jgi:hypothetical protein